MRDVLTLPESGLGRAAETGAAAARHETVALILGAAQDAAAAEAVAGAVERLLAQHGTPAAGPPGEGVPYARAAQAVAEGRLSEALTLLAPLAAEPDSRAEAVLGLAVCAARLGCCDEALILARESRRLAPNHPRASCVAGLCELELGNRRAAQGHLATAARLARRDPAFGEDLRLAQRALLLMHLA
ncbi:hypothetical protein BHAOGJBA_4997 [Methylobacterium hispanicum]|uniref:Tetratricopeptide repeat protein n=1 Tax=Methylobacterium hispanicum TaxID=270350 RepID=A0AAV4ZTH7_9HYPH|nr:MULTISPECIES: hypothetical protein [Methylobacterium]GJD91449.1 hypothetical protein BHAOGJBA_4997 [Methylobacterium hispanicum]